MTEVREEHRELVKADLMKRMPTESKSAQEVAQIKEDIELRKRYARRLRADRSVREDVEVADLKSGTPDTYDLRGATPVEFTLSTRGKDGSVAEERRVAFVHKMEVDTPVWARGTDGSLLSFSASLLDASPVSKVFINGERRMYPKLDKQGQVESVMRVDIPRRLIK
ncbi:hypothetical protein HYV22_03320 [Candidatus Gottesmanbacteria bacterium]|nr:hypothetical protein [Candidatus Gottesmanbacteria bacterium]